MKAFCRTCGAHFPQEFEITLTNRCSFWRDRGLAKLPERYKMIIWDWFFMLPMDQIFGETKYLLAVQIIGRKSSIKQRAKFAWHKVIKGYNRMSEQQRQAFQRDFYKKEFGGTNGSISK